VTTPPADVAAGDPARATPPAGVAAADPARRPNTRPAGEERPDLESRRWVARLNAHARDRADAMSELHAVLLAAARFEVRRRAATIAHLRGEELDDIAAQAADDALVAVLAKLDGYRGASRFTTWAYKFALLEAGVAMRRRAWQAREVVLTDDAWSTRPALDPGPAEDAETAQLLRAITAAAHRELTPHQRQVLLALAVDGVPIDVLAGRLNTTRGALYKTLHDARRKLRRCLAADGLLPPTDRRPPHA
jgi:RNA polymerase sigma-70 factor (ECF subfamily)